MTGPLINLPGRAMPNSGGRAVVLAALAGLSLLAVLPALCAGNDSDREPSARELYNDGAHKLTEGRLGEAESYLQSAVASQDDQVQPAALYDLGFTRFQLGVNELTNAPEPRALESQSSYAGQSGASALHEIDDALAGNDLQAMVAAYLRGRGARKELKNAITAVQHAMDTYGIVLAKWRRASGDFHSTVELQPKDSDAQTNADLTDRYIAKLVDRFQMMMSRRSGMEQQREELRKKMGMLKGRFPDQTGPPMLGDDGDDDEDGKTPPRQPKAGDEEGPAKNGQEIQLTLEEARRLLGLLQLDTGRQLYLNNPGDDAKPRDPKARDW